MTRCQALRPGSRASKLSRPPNVRPPRRWQPRSRAAPSVSRALEPRRPAADDQRPARRVAAQDLRDASRGGIPRRPWGSGCSGPARRHASCAMHMLQPMHSRISSLRPSAILRGRNGSAIDGRAAPMKSRMPRRICDDHGVGRGEAADADHRLAGDRLDEVDHRLMACLRREAGGGAIGRARVHLHVEQVGVVLEQRDHLMRLGSRHACRAACAAPRG